MCCLGGRDRDVRYYFESFGNVLSWNYFLLLLFCSANYSYRGMLSNSVLGDRARR